MSRDVIQSSQTNAAPPVALSEQARQYLSQSLRPNTRRAYAAQLRLWLAWCDEAGLDLFPSDPNAVANFLISRADAGQAISTLRTVVAAIKGGNDAKGCPFDTKAPVILKALRSIQNVRPRLPRQAEALRGKDVLNLMDGANVSLCDLRNNALLALGYCFALRESELIGLDLEALVDGTAVLRITAMTMEIQFAQSKTDRNGSAPTVAIPRVENAEAVKAVERWVSAAGIAKGSPILRRVRKGDKVGPDRMHPLSVARIIKNKVGTYYRTRGASEDQATDVASRFSGHSLRVGFCVTAAEGGADLRAIARVSRHRSLAMPMRYTEKAEQLRSAPHMIDRVGLKRR